MMKTLLFSALALFINFSFAQISVGQSSDFQSGTQGWEHGQVNANSPFVVANNGPAGAGDAFLRTTNSGAPSGPGSKHAFINSQPEWTGDYTAAGVVSINFDVQNTGTKDLSLRIGLQSNNNSRWAVTSVPVVISAGTAWTNVSFNIDEASMFSAGDPSELVSDILTDVTIIKIFSNDGTILPEYQGDNEVLFSDYDNITASSSLSVADFMAASEFTISPNPSRNKLNVKLSNYNESLKLEVFDVLGKKIHMSKVTNLETTVNVSNWKSGVYLVKLSNDNVSQTKRFIKL